MRVSRIYLPIDHQQLESSWVIEQPKAHYIRSVLRLKPGNALRFFTATGRQYEAVIKHIGKHDVVIEQIQVCSDLLPECTLETTLVQGISSSERMDYSIQKAAELGCQTMIPVFTDFCSQRIARHKYDKKQQHWQAVAISACEQSGRVDIMDIRPIQTLNEVIKVTQEALYFEPTAEQTLHELPQQLQKKQAVIIGPEGGFSPTELDQFKTAGYSGICLGQRVLRTETMAAVALSALHTLYGDFKQVPRSY